MAKKRSKTDPFDSSLSPTQPLAGGEKLKFSQFLTSQIVTVIVGKSRKFYLHYDFLVAESERFLKGLTGEFKEAKEYTIELKDEDPELFGFFVEYLYRDCSILSRSVENYDEFVTLARLYAMGERLLTPTFQAYCIWRFTESLSDYNGHDSISNESVCELLRIACTEITERLREDPMSAHIFWYAGVNITRLRDFGMFRQLLCDIPDLGKHLVLWVKQSQPKLSSEPNDNQYLKFEPESEYSLRTTPEVEIEPPKMNIF